MAEREQLELFLDDLLRSKNPCKGCANNPNNNPSASGICLCTLATPKWT